VVFCERLVPESVSLPASILEGAMASATSILKKMIAAMNRGGDASKRALLKAKDIEMSAKPKPKRPAHRRKALFLCEQRSTLKRRKNS
jgi:hypothetical protein